MGDLLSYLKIHDNVFTAKRMHNYAEQIATAMDFLKQQGIVHRNLAAKSIVVRNHDQVLEPIRRLLVIIMDYFFVGKIVEVQRCRVFK